MNSPLKFDEDNWEDLGIDKSVDYEDELKLGSSRSKRDEIKHALWNVRTDLMIAQYQVDDADDDNIKTQHMAKVNEHKMLVKQFARSVRVLNEVVRELEAKLSN